MSFGKQQGRGERGRKEGLLEGGRKGKGGIIEQFCVHSSEGNLHFDKVTYEKRKSVQHQATH